VWSPRLAPPVGAVADLDESACCRRGMPVKIAAGILGNSALKSNPSGNNTIRAFLTESTITTVLNLLMIFIYFTVLFLYNIKLTLMLIAFVIPILALTVLITPKVKRFAREVFGAVTDARSYLMEALGGAETIKGMGIERAVQLKWESKYAKALEVHYRSQSFNIAVSLAGQLLNAATTIAVLWLGADLVLTHELSIGQLVALNALMGSVLAPLMGLVGLWSLLNEASVAMERLGDVLDIEPEQRPEDLASRVAIPSCRVTSVSTAFTSAMAATRRPMSSRTSLPTSSPASWSRSPAAAARDRRHSPDSWSASIRRRRAD